ncbi:hypothetical protein WDW37_18710 [Bdellovibrionota bacterium FG-1]
MKFTHAWAATSAQNVTLKVGLVALGICTLALTITTARLALKEPLVIERGCLSRTVSLTPGNQHSATEIETFVREAITQRFNSDWAPQPGFLSPDEEAQRLAEQKELSARGMTQKVIVNGVKSSNDTVTLDADRLISVGSIRSAFLFSLTLTLASTPRSESNPYGLMLIKISQPKGEVSK